MWHGLGPNALWNCISINFSKFFVCITSACQKFKGTMGSSFLCATVFLKSMTFKLLKIGNIFVYKIWHLQ